MGPDGDQNKDRLFWRRPAAIYWTKRRQGFPHQWTFSKVRTCPLFTHVFQPSLYIRLYNKIVQANNQKSYKIMRMNMFVVYD
jgi:hypothetical protein